MKTLQEIEEFLERETKGDYKVSMPREEKIAWIATNGDYCKKLVFKMAYVGKTTWNNFLWSFNLEETIRIEIRKY